MGSTPLLSPIQRESLLHPSKIPYDRERRQNHTTKTPRLHLALLIQSLVYAFLVREQSSDGFNGALNAVLGAFHQFFFLNCISYFFKYINQPSVGKTDPSDNAINMNYHLSNTHNGLKIHNSRCSLND